MSPFRLPGWELANGHVVRSQIEASLCEYLAARAVPHAHASLLFDLELGHERHATFIPDILLLEDELDGRKVIIEAMASIRPGGGVRRLAAFLRQHGQQHFLIVVAKRVLCPHIPEDAYDALVPLEEFAQLDRVLAGEEL
jgi:hypothetical protein